MKSRMILCILLLGLLGLVSTSFATPKVVIDNHLVQFDVDPVIENGRTMVPFRKIFEELDLKVEWNDYSKIATAYNEDTFVSIKVDEGYGNINGKLFELDASARIINGRILVPLRFISEAFGKAIQWDSATYTATISSGFKPTESTDPLPKIESYEKFKSILAYADKDQNNIYPEREFILEDSVGVMMEKSEASSEATNSADSSETNVQVTGVDEADIIKTDGSYIYHVRSNDVVITKAEGSNLTKVSSINMESGYSASELYVKGNHLIIIGTELFPMYRTFENVNSIVQERMILPYRNPSTKVLIYNIEKPSTPVKERELFLEGEYFTSRMIDNQFYLIANKYVYPTYELEEAALPHYKDSLSQKVESIGFDKIQYFPDSVSQNYLILAGINLEQMDEKADVQVLLGAGNNVYMSKENLYVALSKNKYTFDQNSIKNSSSKYTSIFKFAVSHGKFKYQATGEANGHILNQFSMDESSREFRIATTSGEIWQTGEMTSKNNIYVFDSTMNLKGSIEGIAPGEKIYSVRFLGDRAYMVTFRQVDPFFVVDLSNGSAPNILGYLKIPGYSDYLHPYDKNTIIGFGKDTVETKSGVRVEGFKMGMFDVTDVGNPIEKFKVSIGGSGTYSELLNNHKALLFSKEKNTLGFPINIQEKNENNQSVFSFQGAYIYSLSPVDGFILRGKSSHLSADDYAKAGNYWYESDKNVLRAIYIGDVIYTLSKSGIKAHNFDTLEEISNLNY